MIRRFKKLPFKLPLVLIIIILGSISILSFKPNKFRSDPYMVQIPGGSFYMGPSDEQVDMSMVNRKKLVSITGFWMDRTEVTNQQYRKFVKYVSDSLKYLAVYAGGVNQAEDTVKVDWNRALRINTNSKAVIEKLNELLLSPDNRIQGKVEIDPTKLIYRYSYVDLRAAAKSSKGLEQPLSNFLVSKTEAIYPDSLVWMRDFSYSYNEPYTRLYFSHPSYNDYPVVGITWKQAVAFCHWRTNNSNFYLDKGNKRDEKIDGIYRLPTEAEWEYAARGNSKTNNMYPWGSPYTRTKEGRLLANFKPGRGDYFGSDAKNDNIYTSKVQSFPENGYKLYDMAGNVAEWTSSVYYEGGYNFMGDFSPDLQYNAKDEDPISMKRKVVRGGSWKDIAYNIQVSTRNYEYQDTAKSYIGFRCVLSMAPRIN
ncbi:MAG: gliding motility-associated lipoprotein [Chitinophagia bacterium]|jgi:gliding motility-associated lipoprotein GldK|nr:gliding motility-associated lipoprotein [Chitinophagia bacterium]NCA29700.1 gliding motility-associated lipoprotein [Chitinophagia bacterium]NDD15391.1 gliding motility-associated lipoprotein [Chitinophagia bacterium]